MLNNETFATGLVKPKTTSLFFDKIWIPSNLKTSFEGEMLGYNVIPDAVRLKDDAEKWFDSYSDGPANCPYESVDGIDYLFSKNRNNTIMRVVRNFKRFYDIDVTPIFLHKTEFEKMLMCDCADIRALNFLSNNKYISSDKEPSQMLKIGKNYREENLTTDKTDKKVEAIEVCINFIPEVLEDRLDWQQVLDMRADKESIMKLRKFKNWVITDLSGKTEKEIIASLEQTLDEYTFALRKHGVLTTIGGLSTILSAASSVLSMSSDNRLEILSTAFVITAGILTYSSSQAAEYLHNKKSPIAYIYLINQKAE